MDEVLEKRLALLKKLLAEKKVFGYINEMGEPTACTKFHDLETLFVFGGMSLLLIERCI